MIKKKFHHICFMFLCLDAFAIISCKKAEINDDSESKKAAKIGDVTDKEIKPYSEGYYKGGFDKIYGLLGNMTLKDNINKTTHFKAIPETKENKYKLRVFYISDLHNNLRATHKTKGDTHYFSQMVKIVKEGREKVKDKNNEIVLFLSAGDDHIGSAFDELWVYDDKNILIDDKSVLIDPAYTAYSEAGLDAAVIGNHELDKTATLLAKSIKAAGFPVLSANLFGSQKLKDSKTLKNLYYSAILGVSKGLRIGIIGLTIPEEILTQQPDDPTLQVSADINKTLTETFKYIEPHADVIILLSHLGYDAKLSKEQTVPHLLVSDNRTLANYLYQKTTKPAFIVGGHTHLALNQNKLEIIESGIPILQAGGNGNYLGEFYMELSKKDKNFSMVEQNNRLIKLKKRDDTKPDKENYEQDTDYDKDFDKNVMEPKIYHKLDSKLSEEIGTTSSSTELSTDATILGRYKGHSAIINFMNDAVVERSSSFKQLLKNKKNNVVSVFNATGVSKGVNASSTITFNDWFSVMPYADSIILVQMNAKQITEMLNSNAKRIVRESESAYNNEELSRDFISRGFLHFSKNLRYTIKLNNDASNAIAKDITINNNALKEDDEALYDFAFTDFIAIRGSEGWGDKNKSIGAGLADIIKGYNIIELPKQNTGLIYRNEILAHIKDLKDKRRLIDPKADDKRLTIE